MPEQEPAAERPHDPAVADTDRPRETLATEQISSDPGAAVEPRAGGADLTPERAAEGASDREERRGSFFREVPFLVLIALVVAVLIKTFLVQAFFIPSASMEPTLMPGDRVLVNKFVYRFGDIHWGDVIVFENPDASQVPNRNWIGGALHWLGEGLGVAQPENEDLIKRVIGLPGDTVEIRGHTVSVNGDPLTEPYLTPSARAAMADFGPVTVPANALFVMGDNRGNSADSRFSLGTVPEDKVIGRAFVIIWPPSDLGGLG
ncbi:MAG TPA: signal peptidase I [Actinomycetota bacterium]